MAESLEHKLQWAKDNPFMCVEPWRTIDIRASDIPGKLRANCCCNLDYNKFKYGLILDETFDNFNEVKSSMLGNRWHPGCNKCRKEELAGGQSERIRSILGHYDYQLADLLEKRSIDNYEIRIKFSNKCVQACRMCCAEESSLWQKIAGIETTTGYEIDITEDPAAWDHITKFIVSHIGKHEHFYIHLMGGETLIQDGARKLLNWCVDNGYEKYLRIRLTTSFSVIPDGILDLLLKFIKTQFVLSIDSVGDNYRYVRWPVEFQKVEQNLLNAIGYNNARYGNFAFIISPVFSLNNIFYIDDFIDYWDKFLTWAGRGYIIMNTNLTLQTHYLDVQALPIQYRQPLIEKLTNLLSHNMFVRHREETIHIYNFLTTTINELNRWPNDLILWSKFLTFTAEFDRRTDTKFSILNSRLYDMLTEEDKLAFDQELNKVNILKRIPIKYTYDNTKI